MPDVHKTHRHTPLLSSSQTLWQDTPSDHPTKRATHTAAAGGTIPHTLNHVRHTHTHTAVTCSDSGGAQHLQTLCEDLLIFSFITLVIIISALFLHQDSLNLTHTHSSNKKCDDITFKFSFALKQQNDPQEAKEDAKERKDESHENAKAVQM